MNIEDEWNGFAARVLPKDAPQIQRQEMRRAFFAGVHISLLGLSDLSAGDEDRAIEALEDMHRQCREFAARVEIGVA
jgi:hypothetical protein